MCANGQWCRCLAAMSCPPPDWRWAFRALTIRYVFSVAQVSNLLYRRFPIGSALYASRAPQDGRLAGWKHCDTAGWKPALRAGGWAQCCAYLWILVLISLISVLALTESPAATLIVTNTSDSGAGSLRQAPIDDTTGADTIVFKI